jgi:hypothetical protein
VQHGRFLRKLVGEFAVATLGRAEVKRRVDPNGVIRSNRPVLRNS